MRIKKTLFLVCTIICASLSLPSTPSAQAQVQAQAGYKESVPPKYSEVKRFSEGMAPVKLNGKWGFVAEVP